MSNKGKIIIWNDDKGFGFIAPNKGRKQIFVHISAFNTRNKKPEINQMVTYTVSTDDHGRLCAKKVARAGELPFKNIKKGRNYLAFFIPICFIIFVSLYAFTSKKVELIFLPFYYLVISLFTFILYAVDKSAAQKNSWRISENTLHLFSLAGGWLGAMMAQQTFRHKTKKQSFRAVFWVTVVLNTGVFIWLVEFSNYQTVLSYIVNNVL